MPNTRKLVVVIFMTMCDPSKCQESYLFLGCVISAAPIEVTVAGSQSPFCTRLFRVHFVVSLDKLALSTCFEWVRALVQGAERGLTQGPTW